MNEKEKGEGRGREERGRIGEQDCNSGEEGEKAGNEEGGSGCEGVVRSRDQHRGQLPVHTPLMS